MERMERIMNWKQEVIDDINILQRKRGVKNEDIERLKAEFLVETNSIKISELKNKLYTEIDKQKVPEITLRVAAVKLAKDGSIISSFAGHKIDNLFYDTRLIKETELYCTEKSGRQLRFYMVKGRDTYRGYEELARRDVTGIVQNYIKNNSFHTAYELREERGIINE